MKHYRKAATRHDRLDETFLANLQLILIAIYLKKHSQKPNECKHTPVFSGARARFSGLSISTRTRRECRYLPLAWNL